MCKMFGVLLLEAKLEKKEKVMDVKFWLNCKSVSGLVIPFSLTPHSTFRIVSFPLLHLHHLDLLLYKNLKPPRLSPLTSNALAFPKS